MSYSIDRQHTFDLVGGSGEDEFDVGAHAASGTVYVARAVSAKLPYGPRWARGERGWSANSSPKVFCWPESVAP